MTKAESQPKKIVTSIRKFLKRPRSSWSFFLQSVKSENPSWKLLEIVKSASSKWKTMSVKDKQQFSDSHAEDLKKYQLTKSTLTPEQKKILKARRKKIRNNPNRKPRVLTSYIKFMTANKQGFATSGMKMTDFGKKLAETWRGMTKEEKAAY